MDNEDWKLAAAAWGAGLSTLLALVKVWELWTARFRIAVDYRFNSLPELGNEITVRNLSGRPVTLVYWDLMLVSRWFPFRKIEPMPKHDWDAPELQIAPHSSTTLVFKYDQWFDWGVKALNKRRIYIRLTFVGRREILRLVYPA